jgi:hypothetical protein
MLGLQHGVDSSSNGLLRSRRFLTRGSKLNPKMPLLAAPRQWRGLTA